MRVTTVALVSVTLLCGAVGLNACGKHEERIVVEEERIVVEKGTPLAAPPAAALTSGASQAAAAPAPPTNPAASTAGTAVTLEILGLHCEGDCVPRVQAMLEHAPGVESVTLDYAAKSAVVKARPGTDAADIAAAVQGGFSASVR